MEQVLVMGIALSSNILVILWKLEHRNKTEALLDAGLLALVMYIAGGTLTGMLVGTIASVVVSVYLLLNPISYRIHMPKFKFRRKA